MAQPASKAVTGAEVALAQRALLVRLAQCQRGGPAMEYALLAPMFLALLIAIMQIALVFIAQQALETAAQGTARLALTGQSQAGAWSAATFKSKACTALTASAPFMSCNGLFVDVATATSFATANTSVPTITYDSSGNVTNSFNYTVGTQGAVVVLKLLYRWPTISAPLGFTIKNQSNGERVLLATSVFKVEPYR
jgi:Flp pilus assembly protein TadG